ncbi:MAG: hypothetical protein ABIZ91_05890 [Gemmatimonadaceae bacterium]
MKKSILSRVPQPGLMLALVAYGVVACAPPAAISRDGPREVRQIVTFLFQPGRADSALHIYERQLLPLYQGNSAMLRFRGYREAESPEPLDLVVVSAFTGMAGMDASNAALRTMSSGGNSVFQWYGALSGLAQWHHDQFAEMIFATRDTSAASESPAHLTVMEYVRVRPGSRARYESLVGAELQRLEGNHALVRWSETGRLVVSDGWDYVRFLGIDSLGEWGAYQRAVRASSAAAALDEVVVARKTIILRNAPSMSVR